MYGVYKSEAYGEVAEKPRNLVHFIVIAKDPTSPSLTLVTLVDLAEFERFTNEVRELPTSMSAMAWFRSEDEKLRISIRPTVSGEFEAEFKLNEYEPSVLGELRGEEEKQEQDVITFPVMLRREGLAKAVGGLMEISKTFKATV